MTTTTPDQIRLSGLSARGYHGVLPFERTEGQLFTADVTLDLGERGTAVASVTDAVKDAVDYSEVARAVVAVIEGEPVSLIETLAARVGEAVLAFPRVTAVEVTIHKPQAPLDVAFEDVSVTIHRTGGEGGHPLSGHASDQAVVPDSASGQWPAQAPGTAGGPVGSPAAAAGVGMASAAGDGQDADESRAPEGAPGLGGAEPWSGSPADGAGGPAEANVPWGSEPAVDAVASDEMAQPWQGAPLDGGAGDPGTGVGLSGESAQPWQGASLDGGAGDPGTGVGLSGESAQPWQGAPAGDTGDAAAPAPAAPVPAPVDVLGRRPDHPVEVVLALGGNVGGVVPALRAAVRTLREIDGIEVANVAPLARTAAIVEPGGPEQPDYLNTVVLATTTLAPREVLSVCQGLEADAGRVRTEPRGPRTLDVDIVTYEGVTSDDAELVLPHPRAAQRAFVLVPWAQADPFAEIGNQYVASLAENAPDRDGVRWLALDWLDSDHLPALPTGQYVAPPEVGDDQLGAMMGGSEPGGLGEESPGAPVGGGSSAEAAGPVEGLRPDGPAMDAAPGQAGGSVADARPVQAGGSVVNAAPGQASGPIADAGSVQAGGSVMDDGAAGGDMASAPGRAQGDAGHAPGTGAMPGEQQIPQDPAHPPMPRTGSASQAGGSQDEAWASPLDWGDVIGRNGQGL